MMQKVEIDLSSWSTRSGAFYQINTMDVDHMKL